MSTQQSRNVFVEELCKYFMDFLQTGFKSTRFPKRYIRLNNEKNFKIGIDLSKYENFNESLARERLTSKETLSKKKDALQLHFKKKRDMAKKAGQIASQEDIIRMRQSQIDNINDLEKDRIAQLESKMMVNGSFQILSILKLTS